MPALNFTRAQSDALSVCWSSLYDRIIGFNRSKSVKLFVVGLVYLDLKHLNVVAYNLFIEKVFWVQGKFFD
jgi:hypothetical protein